MIAHIGGMPVEEILPGLVSGVGAGMLMALWGCVARPTPHGARDMTDHGTLTVRSL